MMRGMEQHETEMNPEDISRRAIRNAALEMGEEENGKYFFRFFESEHHRGLADSGRHGAADAAEAVAQMDSLSAVGAGGVQACLSPFPGKRVQPDSQPGDRPA